MTTPQETIEQQQTIIDALTNQVMLLKESDQYERERCEERIRRSFPGLKQREISHLYAVVVDACAEHERLKASASSPAFDINKANALVAENATLKRRITELESGVDGYHQDAEAAATALVDAFEIEHQYTILANAQAAVVVHKALKEEVERLKSDLGEAQELLRVAKVENGRLARREDEGVPDSGRYSKAAFHALRKNIHQANSHLAEIKRLVKAREKESALEAVQRHFGQATQHGVKNIGAFFKGLRAILGIPDRDHGGLDAIIKAVGALKEEAKSNTETARGGMISEAHAALRTAGISEPGPLARKIGMLAEQRDRARSDRQSYWDRLCAVEKERDIVVTLHKSAERDNVRLTHEVSRLKTEAHDFKEGLKVRDVAEAARLFAGSVDGLGLWAETIDRTVTISTAPPTYSEGFKSWCESQGFNCGDQPTHQSDPLRSLFRAYEAGRSEFRNAAFDPDSIVEPLATDSVLTHKQAFVYTAHRRIAEAICMVAGCLMADPDVSENDHVVRIELRRALSLAESLSDINDDRGSTT